ncbi:hypothetical protein M422DRAFT_267518 [Sphaerobolus stellatus SS14]|uniref:Uncharacterized protein n=1 Tax=Sphaerobolus stellatus (strain SS14) TaxID=990650 RepID=A0A0C9UPN9_SPHS4|nr:hypothetical protein M422DRAFT_267518 [Sphaerobolus stellatus SS14]
MIVWPEIILLYLQFKVHSPYSASELENLFHLTANLENVQVAVMLDKQIPFASLILNGHLQQMQTPPDSGAFKGRHTISFLKHAFLDMQASNGNDIHVNGYPQVTGLQNTGSSFHNHSSPVELFAQHYKHFGETYAESVSSSDIVAASFQLHNVQLINSLCAESEEPHPMAMQDIHSPLHQHCQYGNYSESSCAPVINSSVSEPGFHQMVNLDNMPNEARINCTAGGRDVKLYKKPSMYGMAHLFGQQCGVSAHNTLLFQRFETLSMLATLKTTIDLGDTQSAIDGNTKYMKQIQGVIREAFNAASQDPAVEKRHFEWFSMLLGDN